MITKIAILKSASFEISLINQELDRTGFNYTCVNIESIDDFESTLQIFHPNIIIAGYSLLDTTWKKALKFRNKRYPLIPIIFFSDNIDAENGIKLIKKGVSDIVFKHNISALDQKISQALKEVSLIKSNVLSQQSEEVFKDELWRNESKYRSLIENSMDAILLTVKDGQILEANAAACGIFKMTQEEICKSGRFDIVDITDPRLAILLSERNNTGRAKGELTFKRKDGSCFPGEVTSVVFKDVNGCEMTSMTIKDLSEHKKAEQQLAKTALELQEALNGLHKILNASMDLICSIDAEERIVQINAASKSIWGYEPHELIGKKYSEFIHPEDQETIFNIDQDVRNGNPVKIFETRIIHKNGAIVYILLSAQWDEVDKLIYCTAKDITEKKKLEKAYLVERQRFLDIYDQAPSAMGIIKGPDYVYELANPLYLKLIDKKDIIGKTIMEVLPELKSQGIFELLDSVYNTGEPFISNEMLFKFDFLGNGNLVDKYLNILYQAHRDSDGSIDGILFFAVDVTEQVLSRMKIEESEKLYRELIRELPVAAYSCDAEGKITIFNKAAAALWGREPEIGKDLWCGSWNILSNAGQEIPLNLCPMAIAMKEGRTMSGMEIIIERENGERRYVLPHAVPYIDAAGKVTGAVNMLTDITESKEVQQALELRNEELAFQHDDQEKQAVALILANTDLLKTNKELDRFVYSVSHDLRSPLTSIQGLVSIIEDESKEPETLAHVQMIKSSINRLDEFIRKILIYSQNNRTGIEVETITVKKTIMNIVDSLQNMEQAKGINFEIDIHEDTTFSSDQLRFNTILENLISNAIKYHKPIDTERFIKVIGKVDEEMLQLQISDNGIGIATKYQDKIFDMFFRISSKSEGSGIGLYIVKDTVEKLEGSIQVHSQINDGTTFDIILKNFTL
ncbi:PAS domain S-box-containing protein [Flavobacterium sp. CG_23.5]|uniref:PAS domain S-box protein n=1 Tax=Flavobacterium sp. CG_23.5 TaxID=2760708 RepID=UPI001AEAD4B8|nr:PAS domain S-box protein [Flavobacterium sp. CG_23.5]MBP2284800.1 PAS domain S-box-containing protein [Flavobacterium sp. CG_23.5]